MKLSALKCIWQEKSANANIQTPRGQPAHRWKYDRARTQFCCLRLGLQEKTEACRKDFPPRSKRTEYSGVPKFIRKRQRVCRNSDIVSNHSIRSAGQKPQHIFKKIPIYLIIHITNFAVRCQGSRQNKLFLGVQPRAICSFMSGF